MVMTHELIGVPVREYKNLLRSQAKLDALEAGGVDNWEWYEDVLEDFFELDDNGGVGLMSDLRIISNQIKCLICGDTPFSAHRHDFKYCKCGSVAVDGGQDYLRRTGNLEDYEEQSVTLDSDLLTTIVKSIESALETRRNSYGIAYAVIRAIRDSGNCIKERV